MNKKLLWVGDAGCPSGFARATHEILETLRATWDITVLGINYRGDPHEYPYPIYVAGVGGDSHGIGRLIWMCDLVQPDLIVLQQDPWNVLLYMRQLKKFPEYADIPVVASMAVDGKNLQGGWFEDVTLAIFWTQFALDEARLGGYTGEAVVIPLGVDLSVFKPTDQLKARRSQLPSELDDAFIVGNVNRNQPRKRWDLTIRYFAEWVRSMKIDNAYLYLHVAPTGDTGCSVNQLARYYGVLDRMLIREPPTFYGDSDARMVETYNSFDVAITTTQGEGMGLTTLEAMACGVPVIAPDWSALGDWAKDAIWLVKCSTTAIGPPYVNILGGVPDQKDFILALNRLYTDPKARETNSKAGLERVNHPRFRWANIGKQFNSALEQVVTLKEEKTAVTA